MNKKLSRLLEPGEIWYCAVLLVFAIAAALLGQFYLAAGEFVVTAVVFFVSRSRFLNRRHALMEYVQSATDAVGISVHAGSPFPMAVIRMPEHEIIWGNPGFYAITGLDDSARYQTMDAIIPGFSTNWLQEGQTELAGDQVIQGRRYRVYGNYVRAEDDASSVLLATVYFADMTEMFNVRDEYMRTRPIVCLLLIDNYDELTNNLSDAVISNINARLNETVSTWAQELNALCRRLERNRYLVIFESQNLPKLQESKFSILESIRSVTSPSGIAATISLGIGKDGVSYEEDFAYAQLSVEMSLSRGGDQAVIKDRYNFTFYGGHAREAERHSRVKSRVVAGSLSELIAQSSQVFIMGHRSADLDSVGAAVGLGSLCRKLNKPAKIVIDLQKNAAGSLLELLKSAPDFTAEFCSGDDALVAADSKSLLIIVDTNRPEQVESLPLLESIPRVAVIDHHRRAADYIDQVVLNMHDPYTSSASELVSELLQYAVDPKELRPIEAQSLLAGIVLDTKNFSVRTGSRTFEAAAFLRRAGAEPVEVKRLFQSDLDSVLLRYKAVQAAKLYKDDIAIAAVDSELTRVVASQAADELLNIAGIQTSFVLYSDGKQVVISARSIGKCNVQLVLEPLGGGGNAATAGAQIRGVSVDAALNELVASIDRVMDR